MNEDQGEQRKGWPSAEKNDENERACENTCQAGRGACTSSSAYSQLPLAHRPRLSYLPGMRAQHMEHESPQVESHCQTMSIHEYLIMSGHRNTSYCIDIVRTLNEASLVARVHMYKRQKTTVPRYAQP